MKRFSILAVLLGVVITSPVAGQTCQPPGWVIVGAGSYYDHIANGLPVSLACWQGGADLVTDTLCGRSSKAFDFTYGDGWTQTIVVPPYMTETNWELSYFLDFRDPHNDGSWHRITTTVYDVTTGRNLVYSTYRGDYPDLACALRSHSFTGNYAGHTLRVRFTGGRLENDTIIRVRDIILAQW